MDHVDEQVVRLASRRWGVISALDLSRVGYGPWLSNKQERLGFWIPVAKGVWRLAAFPRSWFQDLTIAWAASGERGVVSGCSAAGLHRLTGFAPVSCADGSLPVEVSAPPPDPVDVTIDVVTGLPVTTVARTVVDLSASRLPDAVLLSAVRSAGAMGVTPADILRRSDARPRLPGRRHPGERRLLRVLSAAGEG